MQVAVSKQSLIREMIQNAVVWLMLAVVAVGCGEAAPVKKVEKQPDV